MTHHELVTEIARMRLYDELTDAEKARIFDDHENDRDGLIRKARGIIAEDQKRAQATALADASVAEHRWHTRGDTVTVAALLVAAGLKATYEYPGCIEVVNDDGSLDVLGTANNVWESDHYRKPEDLAAGAQPVNAGIGTGVWAWTPDPHVIAQAILSAFSARVLKEINGWLFVGMTYNNQPVGREAIDAAIDDAEANVFLDPGPATGWFVEAEYGYDAQGQAAGEDGPDVIVVRAVKL